MIRDQGDADEVGGGPFVVAGDKVGHGLGQLKANATLCGD